MKRSELDDAVEAALELAAGLSFALPDFARWRRQHWADHLAELRPTLERGLGWDVTDFGRGEFGRFGLTLCTLRNGSLAERDAGTGQTYAEKVMAVRVGQETPFHSHAIKTEDIINRGGGYLDVELYPMARTAEQLGLGKGVVATFVDGVYRQVAAGQRVTLAPGQSIQVPRGVMHRFWAVEAPVLAAEVSCVNDDAGDNTFLEPAGRFPLIVEDVPARYLLAGEYPALLGSVPGGLS
ncbi:MAG: D-lyxose/D-mannose family sugar isomerase [Bifidobacteriaceae bacterium]|jgi:D-lyxose ketol-isomerase|nr:D-lyxose/D-mannose family sugar isomerase [Bifidobacteriaceae bacterium]